MARAAAIAVESSGLRGAHNTFNDVMDRFNMSMNKVQTALVEISENIKSNAVGYEGAEDEAVQGLSAVGGALDM